MESTGRVIAVLEPKTGQSAKGTWQAQDFVIETHDQYPKKQCFNVFGANKMQQFGIAVGQEIKVSFEYESREANGRWFTTGRAYAVEHLAAQTAPQQTASQPSNEAVPF